MTAVYTRSATATRPRTMRAAVIDAPGQVRLRDVPVPTPGPGEVRVRLQGCGVCASNVPVWDGRPWFNYPTGPGAPGHEGWGVIDAVGEGVDQLDAGQRVALLSYHAFAEFDVAPADRVVPLPAVLDGKPFPGEPLGCAVNVFERMDVRAGHTVAVIGVGFMGALVVQLCRRAGARVIAVSRRPASLELAQRCGADELVRLDEPHAAVARIAGLTGGVGGYGAVTGWCDRVIECTGHQAGLDLIGEIAAVRGRVGIAGFHQDGPRTVDVQLWNWRGLDVINTHERAPARYLDGIRRAAQAAAQGTIDLDPLFTHPYPLQRLGDALDAARDRPDGFVKAIVETEGAA